MASQRKTKILATLGRKTRTKEDIVELIKAGVDGVRLSTRFLQDNLSEVMANIRAAESEMNTHLAVMLTLRESDIRIGTMNPLNTLSVQEGDVIHITTNTYNIQKPNIIYCNNKELPNVVKPGTLLIAEFGKACFTVLGVESVAVEGGKSNRGMIIASVSYIDESHITTDSNSSDSLPNFTKSSMPLGSFERHPRSSSHSQVSRLKRTKPKKPKQERIVVCRAEHNYTFRAWSPVHIQSDTPILFQNELEDIRALEWATHHEVDFVVYKQVRGIEDLDHLFAFNTLPSTKRLVGIQTKESTRIADQLIAYSDGVVLGRGNLALETSVPEAIKLQKKIVKLCNENNKPVVLSTQMLDSMVLRTRPSRTEVVDISNSIYDGVDAVLLTSETAHGVNPTLAVETCHNICMEAEKYIDYAGECEKVLKSNKTPVTVSENICYCAVRSVVNLGLRLIICMSHTGNTPLLISKFKPPCGILALSDSVRTVRNLKLVRGVFPYYVPTHGKSESFVDYAMSLCKSLNLVTSGDMTVVVTGGKDWFHAGDTCSFRVARVP
jgi:pyruvate kinase